MESASSPVLLAKREKSPRAIFDSLRNVYGRFLERIHAPAKIREFEYVDPVTNETIYLSTGARYSVLHVGGKQLFFCRTTGRFDGTGSSLFLEQGIADGLELVD